MLILENKEAPILNQHGFKFYLIENSKHVKPVCDRVTACQKTIFSGRILQNAPAIKSKASKFTYYISSWMRSLRE